MCQQEELGGEGQLCSSRTNGSSLCLCKEPDSMLASNLLIFCIFSSHVGCGSRPICILYQIYTLSIIFAWCHSSYIIFSPTLCSYHVTYAFQSESTLYSCLNVKELLARNRRKISTYLYGAFDCMFLLCHVHVSE